VRTLSLRELNRATLARQLLLARRCISALRLIERLAGMQGQWAPAPYVGVWSRIEGFRRETLERAILRGVVLKPTVMRGTLHLVTARDYPVFHAALRDYGWWADADAIALGRKAANGIRKLYADGPQPFGVADEYLARRHGLDDELSRRRAWYAARIGGHVLHAPDTALWKPSTRTTYAAVPAPDDVDVADARRELVRRYLGAFGPASRADIGAWSGMRVGDVVPALEALEPLRRFRDEDGRELVDLPRTPIPAPDTPAPIRFLPKWDNVLLGFADRRRMLTDEQRKSVVMNNGDVLQTVLVDGVVAGTWTRERERVRVEPFVRLTRTARAELDDEARRLEAFLR
jgi:hypothetical protein